MMASQFISVNQLNVLMFVMIAFAFLAAELRNAVNGNSQFNQKRLPQYLLNIPPRKYCGEDLSSTLQIVCDSTYNSMYEDDVQEKATTGHPFDDKRIQVQEEVTTGHPFDDKRIQVPEEVTTGHTFDDKRIQVEEEATIGHTFDDKRIQATTNNKKKKRKQSTKKKINIIEITNPFVFEYSLFVPQRKVQRMLDSLFARRRYRRESPGIYEECCVKACAISELSSYCADEFR